MKKNEAVYGKYKNYFSTRSFFTYALPCIGSSFLFTPILILQGIYSKYYSLSFSTIAAVILLSRIFDAITDPLIGYYSDRYFARTGSRKPIMAVGGVLLAISGHFLYSPPVQITTIYFCVWLTLFYLGWTLFEIPHMTWGGELAVCSTQKGGVYSFRIGAGYFGLVLFYSIPLLPFFESNAITPETLRFCGIAGPLTLLLLLALSLRITPNNRLSFDHVRPRNQMVRTSKKTLFLAANDMVSNKPFMLLMACVILIGFATYLWYGTIFIYVDAYLGAGEQFASMFLMAFVFGIASTPLWKVMTAHYGSSMAFMLAVFVMLCSYLYTGLLRPGEDILLELTILKAVNTLGNVGSSVALLSLISDVSDYGIWKSGVNRSASYFSIFLFFSKLIGAFGAAFGLAVIGFYGFDASSSVQVKGATESLIVVTAWLPASLMLVALVFIYIMPMNTHRHNIIRRRLDSKPIPV